MWPKSSMRLMGLQQQPKPTYAMYSGTLGALPGSSGTATTRRSNSRSEARDFTSTRLGRVSPAAVSGSRAATRTPSCCGASMARVFAPLVRLSLLCGVARVGLLRWLPRRWWRRRRVQAVAMSTSLSMRLPLTSKTPRVGPTPGKMSRRLPLRKSKLCQR